MKRKTIMKIVVDIEMTVMLLLLMTWNRDVLSFHYPPCFESKMESVCFQREIYIVSYLADCSCYWNPVHNGRFHV